MKVTLSDWAQIAEIIAAAGIIASLAFVGIQLSENSSEVQSATYQAIADSDMSLLAVVVQSEELAQLNRTFIVAPERLSEAELARATMLATFTMRNFENVYEQYRREVLPPSRWDSIQNVLDRTLRMKGYTCFFALSLNGDSFVGPFREDVIDPILAQSPFATRINECPETLDLRTLADSPAE